MDSDQEYIGLAPRFVPLCRSKDKFLIGHEDGAFYETGIAADILAAMVRCQTIAEVEDALKSSHDPQSIRAELAAMEARGILHRGREPRSAQRAYWDTLDSPSPVGTVAFRPICTDGCEAIAEALKSTGLMLADDSSFLLVATDDYLRPELAQIDSLGVTWMLAKPVGHTIWIGPIFQPGQTPCWRCMTHWLKLHRKEQAALYGCARNQLLPQPSFASLPSTLTMAAGMIATAVALRMANRDSGRLAGAILSFDTRTFQQHRSVVRWHPNCDRCGSKSNQGPLHSDLSPLTGIVSGIDLTDSTECGFYHALATFDAPLPEAGVRRLVGKLRAVGKGVTADEAETCAIAEAVERYSTLFKGSERGMRAEIREVGGIPPDEILLFSDRQYEDRETWNATHSEIQWVPERFDPAEQIEWTEARSLLTDEFRFVPSALCYMHYDFRGARQFCSADSNGCGTGPTLDDAILAAILELIERDAVAIWWYNRLILPTIELASLGDSRILQIEQEFRRKGRTLSVIDATTDIGIPAYVAIAARFDGSEPCFGAAADCSPRRAAFKAIAEASQICFWVGKGAGTEELLGWVRSTSIHDHPYLRGRAERPACEPKAMLPAVALRHCVERLKAAGLDSYYVDLTRPEIAAPAARAIVPGLRHFWARFAPGRLYNVPIRQGILSRPLPEEQLNPVPCMI